MYKNLTVTAILPALDESASIGSVITDLIELKNADHTTIMDDIIVCDNGSIDDTAKQAKVAGARVIHETQRGYGAACLKAISNLQNPDIIVFVDADRSVIVEEVVVLLNSINDGNDLVIGSRVLGQSLEKTEMNALTFQQRVGNRLASFLIRLLWRHPVTDLGPFRAIRYDSLQKIMMQDKRCGWTVEMQVKAIQAGLNVDEVPVSSIKRIGRSKISGTFKGTLIAAKDIFSMIFSLWWQERTNNTFNIPSNSRN